MPKRKRSKRRSGSPSKRGPQRCFWVFTDNGEAGTKGSELVPEAWKELPDGLRYMTWQLERTEDTGQLHLQGYLEVTRSRYQTWLHKHVSLTAAFFVRRGTQEQAITYCHKEKTRVSGPYSLGKKGEGQGERTDLDSFRDAIAAGTSLRSLKETHLKQLARYGRLYDRLQPLARPRRREGQGVQVTICYGKPGTGKTRSVYDDWEDDDQFYRIPSTNNGNLWLDGFDHHEKVLLDEFAGASSHMRLDKLLEIMDRYPLRLNTKGSFAWYHPTHLVITTNIHPSKWYSWEGREVLYLALKRRVGQVLLFDADHEKPTVAGEEFWWDPVLDPPPIHMYKGDKPNDFEWGPFKIHEKPKEKDMSSNIGMFTL